MPGNNIIASDYDIGLTERQLSQIASEKRKKKKTLTEMFKELGIRRVGR